MTQGAVIMDRCRSRRVGLQGFMAQESYVAQLQR